jgi:hypothetical protein
MMKNCLNGIVNRILIQQLRHFIIFMSVDGQWSVIDNFKYIQSLLYSFYFKGENCCNSENFKDLIDALQVLRPIQIETSSRQKKKLMAR